MGAEHPPGPFRNRYENVPVRVIVALMALEVSLIGPPRVTRDGRPVTFDTRKAMALLAHLALAGRPRSREALCELLWPGHDTDHARGALRRTLSALRKSVGEEWIETRGDSVALLRGAGLELDIERFRELAAGDSSIERLNEAVTLLSGGFLEGFAVRDSPDFDDWQMAEAGALERELAVALQRLVDRLVARGEYARAIPHARRWLELDPLNESAHRQLIRLYAWSGDRAAALEQYRHCVRALSQELGVGPLDETMTLYEQVNDGTLPVPPKADAAPHPPPAVPAAGVPPELPLVGRAEELAVLVDAHAGAQPDGGLAVIEGEAGIGKTRLAGELVASARRRGAVVLATRCHDDEAGLPYGPIMELLREAVRGADAGGWPGAVPPQRLADASLLLPELSGLTDEVPDPLPLDGPGAQVRLLEGVAAVIGAACEGPQPGVVVFDDVHAADEATLDSISYLGHRLRGRPFLLVVAWRSEAVPPGHRLRRLAADLGRDGRTVIVSPVRLDEAAVETLVQAVRPDAVALGLARRVYLESEGLPLFVAEYLAALHGGGDAEEAALLPEMWGLLELRLGGVSDVARQVLGAAATIGRSFELDIVRQASGRTDEEAVAALEELVSRGVVREVPGQAPGYDFSHDKLRALVYEQTGLARRRLLHGRVAAALSGRAGRESAALVAQHLSLAGQQAKAAEQYRLAAEHAASLYAHADALEHFEAALALGSADTTVLHERIGDLRTLVGDYAGALASYESAAAAAEEGELAAIEYKLGGVYGRRGEWGRSEARLVLALDAAPPGAQALRARIVADLALTLHQAGRSDDAAARAAEALELADAAADRQAQAQAHNMLGMLARSRGDLAAARHELERSLVLADEPGLARAAALNNLALVERDAGELERARELTESALELSAAHGDRHREAALENNLADLHHAAGRADDAMEHLKRAVAIFTEVGADEATRLPEIWKLVSW
jgi:DNA-binding SARP family transcriptional activator/predicted ATPase